MKHAICTGITGSIGLAIAEAFLANYPETELIGTYNKSPGRAEHLVGHDRFSLLQLDLLKPETWKLPEEVDVLINCAGLTSGKNLIEEVPDAEIDSLIAINLKAPFLLARRFIPHMRKSGFGRIVNINSIWGVRGSARNSAYLMTKHGLSGLTKAIAKDHGRNGITANEVCPGAVDSMMMDDIFKRYAAERNSDFLTVRTEMEESLNSGKLVSTDAISNTVIFLCSDLANDINGASIVVDGGEVC